MAGIEAVKVVTGHAADRVEEQLGLARDRHGIRIEAARLDDWSRPNGWSVITGAAQVDGPFLLMMADHIFADGILEGLAQQSLANCDVVLATDRTDNPLVDPEDATWVATDGGRNIRRIGKQIATYDRVDCGAFLANGKLVEAIEEAIAAGHAGSLSDGMQVLADRGRARIWDVGGAWWIDVDDPRAHRLAQEQVSSHLDLFAKAQAQGADHV